MKSNIETEVKIPVDYSIIARTSEIIGNPAWNLQRNYIYQFDGGLLRLRHENNKSFLTVKGLGVDLEFNKRPEVECEIPNHFFKTFSKLRAFLGNPFYYEKSRASAEYNGCTVCLDNLEGRYFVEIEGHENAIRENIKKLGLEGHEKEKRNYMTILMEDKI